MKATIDKHGTLIISAENELEAFALRKWSEEQNNICSGMLINPYTPEGAIVGVKFHKVILP